MTNIDMKEKSLLTVEQGFPNKRTMSNFLEPGRGILFRDETIINQNCYVLVHLYGQEPV